MPLSDILLPLLLDDVVLHQITRMLPCGSGLADFAGRDPLRVRVVLLRTGHKFMHLTGTNGTAVVPGGTCHLRIFVAPVLGIAVVYRGLSHLTEPWLKSG